MKRQLYIKNIIFIACLGMSGTLLSCTDKEETDVYASTKIDFNVTVTPSKVDLPARNASQEIQVRANTGWGVSSDVTWAHVSATSGVANGTFTVTLDDNLLTESRQAIITVTFGTDKKTITITQAAAKMGLSIQELTLGAKGASTEVSVTSNTTWHVEANNEWIHISDATKNGTENGTFAITLDDNKSLQARQGTITVNYGAEGKETILVTQKASDPTSFGKAQVTNVTRHEAAVSSSFASMFDVQEYGIVYSTSNTEPTINEDDRSVLSVKVGITSTSQSDISTQISNLKSATTYYLRFYTRDPLGYEYSSVTTFKTEGLTPGEGDHQTPEI